MVRVGLVLAGGSLGSCIPAPVLRPRDAEADRAAPRDATADDAMDAGASRDAGPDGMDGASVPDARGEVLGADAGAEVSFLDAASDASALDAGGDDARSDAPEMDAGTCDPGRVLRAGSCVEITAARPLWPMSTQTVTQRRPRLRWALGPESDGARVEVCRDRGCATRVLSYSARGGDGAPGEDLPPGPLFWRVWARAGSAEALRPSAVWEVYVPWRSGSAHTAQRDTFDVNGDGYADLVVGVPERRELRTYLGSATGPRSAMVLTDPLIDPASMLLARAGDVNGDGRSDLLVRLGARQWRVVYGPLSSLSGEGSVTLFAPAPTDAGAGDLTLHDLGDPNGDGFSDVGAAQGPSISSLFVHQGFPGGLSRSPLPLTGLSLALPRPLGDLNRDGVEDFVALGIRPGEMLGNLLACAGSARLEAAVVIEALPRSASNAPWAVATRGDFNGDERPDIALRTYRFNEPTPVLFGTSAGLDLSYTYVGTVGRGNDSIGVADFDGDGRLDLVEGNATSALIFVYRGTQAGIQTMSDTTIQLPAGMSVQGLTATGDANGDGFSDVFAISPGASPRQLAVWWIPGSEDRADTTRRSEIERIDGVGSRLLLPTD